MSCLKLSLAACKKWNFGYKTSEACELYKMSSLSCVFKIILSVLEKLPTARRQNMKRMIMHVVWPHNTGHDSKPGNSIVQELKIHRFTVAVWITHSPETLEVTSSRHASAVFLEIHFSNRYSLQHRGTWNGYVWQRDMKFTVTYSVSGDNW